MRRRTALIIAAISASLLSTPLTTYAVNCSTCYQQCKDQYARDIQLCKYEPPGIFRTECYNEASYQENLCADQCRLDFESCPPWQ
jgi:hypothetical protein